MIGAALADTCNCKENAVKFQGCFCQIQFDVKSFIPDMTVETEEEEQRYKRQIHFDESENTEEVYACVKVVIDYTAYRSCIPKVGDIRVNCSEAIGRNVVCYCHTDECNLASTIQQPWTLIATLALIFFTSLMYH